ncbi:MAG: response regulator transcription factor [Chloroflexota bacterium]|nr:response regulator transcription factor [Chloroflexota bacterium]
MSNPLILLVGDEPNILRTLRRNLVNRGYSVEIALDDVEAIRITEENQPDLFVILLDFTFIDVDGLKVCEDIRKKTHSPMIVLSAVGSESVKISALDLGADDYLDMPFSMEEFLARVRVALRRWMIYNENAPKNENLIFEKDLLIDMDARKVTIEGNPIHLTPTEYDLLLHLAKHMGKVISHRDLLKAVWGDVYGDEREYLRVFVSQLRQKIEDDPVRPKYILTVPGVGYRFAAEGT